MEKILGTFALFRNIQMDIESKNFHLVAVNDPQGKLLYAYTIGLFSVDQPEIVFMNTAVPVIEDFLNEVTDQRNSFPAIEPTMLMKFGSTIFSINPINEDRADHLLSYATKYYQICRSTSAMKVVVAISQ
jgi:hypothetical protein